MPDIAPVPTLPGDDSGRTAPLEVQIRLFGLYRDRAGFGSRTLRLPAGAEVADAIERLRAEPGLDVIPDRPLVALNRTYAALGDRLASGDELALIPPVAGG